MKKQPIDSNKIYHMDICAEVNGVKDCGIIMVPWPEDNMIRARVKSPRGFHFDDIQYYSCEKHIQRERRRRRDRLSYELDPDTYNLQCDIKIRAVDTEKATIAEAIIIIQTPRNKLKADIRCNGEWKRDIVGDGGCHAAYGRVKQKIRFKSPVAHVGCNFKWNPDNMNFEYDMPKSECQSFFVDVISGDTFRFRIVPYDDTLLRRY